MTAKVSKINGVTRLHTFEVEFSDFKWTGQRASASAEASTLGFKPGQWPDAFELRPYGTFLLREVTPDEHVYLTPCGGYKFTIFND